MRLIQCSGTELGLAHETRTLEPGYQDILMFREDLPNGPPLAVGHGTLCGACLVARRVQLANQGNVKRALIASIRNKLRTNPVPQFTVAETALIINRLFFDEDSD